METFILAALLVLVLACMAGVGGMLWMQRQELAEERLRAERAEARYLETIQELTTKVKAATLEEAIRYNALMHQARTENVPRGTHARAPAYMTPEMAERLSMHPEIQELLVHSESE